MTDTSHRGDVRRVIIVSPYFPPSSLAGVHRARHLAKHLPAAGWDPIVVCVDEAFHEERLDPALANLVPRSVEILKVKALPTTIMRSFGVGDIGLRGWLHTKRAVERIIATQRIDAVLITGSPFYPMLLASTLRSRGIPVVLDFQDPWVSRWGEALPKLSKAGLSHFIATRLEPRVLRQASYVTSVSDTQNAELAARYPWLNDTQMAAIPIGGDPEDFHELRHRLAGTTPMPGRRVELRFVGSYADRFAPVVRTLMAGVRRLKELRPSIVERMRLSFFGTSALASGDTAWRIRPLAEEAGVADIVHEAPRRLPYLEALSVMASSDGLLLLGSDEPHYTASRIYPALMSGRPWLSLYHRASSAHKVLMQAGGGSAHAFASAEELAGLVPALAQGLERLAIDPGSLGRIDASTYAPYEARSVAKQFAAVFESVARPG